MLQKLVVPVLALLLSLMPVHAVASADTVAAPNLIPNPSLETAAVSTTPDSWQTSTYNSTATANQATFNYLNTGHTGTRSIQAKVTAFSGGSINWYYADVPVTAGQTYQFSDWYQSDVDTQVDAEVMVNGVASYYTVGKVPASSTWKQYTTTFTAPTGATAMSIYHLIAGVGTLTTDDYSLTAYTPVAFNRALVSVTFDDGWASQYTAANQKAMTDNGIPGTYYIISDSSVTNPNPQYMTAVQIKALSDAGNEIGSHTAHHCDLTGKQTDDAANCPLNITATAVDAEMKNSQNILQTLTGKPVTDFAYPYGAYNTSTLTTGSKYYQSQRTVNAGYNSKDSLDTTQLKEYEVDSNITQAQVKAWIDQAIAQKTWLILNYHEIATQQVDPANDDALYTTQPADFAAEMAYIKSKNTQITPLTVAQALAEVKAQIGVVNPPVVKPGDVNGDGIINALDLSSLLANWNKAGATLNQGNLNGDATVDALDLSTLLTDWSK